MQKYSYLSWLETVGKQMWFPPDRDGVLAELADHMADRRADFMEQGMTGLEASEAVAAVMGDPVEIGKAMNWVHNPILGWIWQISRILVLAVVAYGIALWIWSDTFSVGNMFPSLNRDWELGDCQYSLAPYLEGEYRETEIWTGAVEQAGVYTLTLDHGSWVVGAEQQRLTLGFRVKAEHFWDLNPLGFDQRLCAEDDLGNHYQRQNFGKNALTLSANAINLFEQEWRTPYLHVMLTCDDTVERQWIRFYIPGTPFDITVNAKGMVIG